MFDLVGNEKGTAQLMCKRTSDFNLQTLTHSKACRDCLVNYEW